MDEGLCLSEEHKRNKPVDSDGGLSEVVKDLFPADLSLFYPIFLDYKREVEGCDATLDQANDYLKFFHVKASILDGVALSFVAYERVMDILVIRAMYSVPEVRGKGFTKSVFSEFRDPVIMFRTMNDRPPHTLFKFTRNSRTMIHQTPTHTTWIYRQEA